jgi:hypothetical protein
MRKKYRVGFPRVLECMLSGLYLIRGSLKGCTGRS